jgi:ABC-type transporter Mla subunit MlaD
MRNPVRRLILAFTIIAAALLLCWLPFRNSAGRHLDVRAYFQNAAGLNAGASVRVDGVDVGRVSGVRVRPELGERPNEVLMAIRTPYDLSIPNDSLVSLTTQGVLGPTVLDIDTRHAQGPGIMDNAVLKSREVTSEEAAQATKRLKDAIIRAVDKALPDQQTPNSSKPTDSAR